MKAIVGFISAVLSQVFAGLFLGMLWNYSLAPLGLPALPMTSAIAIWGIVVVMVIMLSYIISNVVISVIDYYRRLTISEALLSLAPADNKKKDDDKSA